MNALEIRGLTKRRGDFALQGLDLTLPAGCIMGLIGENGAGKSTTIRLILNALSRDGGTVAVYGKDNRALTALDREDIGAVLDEVGLPEYMTAAQIGRMMAGIFTRWQPEVYRDYLRRLRCRRISPSGLFTGHEDEAGAGGGAEPSAEAAAAGRGHQRP